jgi:hypothetical protein
MKTQAKPGFGCTFAVGDGNSPEQFTVQAEVVEVPGVGGTHITAEATTMTSPGGFTEHIGLGLKELKAFTLPFNFVADSNAQIVLYQTRFASGAAHSYRVKFTDDSGTYLTFEAIVTDIDITHAQRAKADLAVQFLPTGPFSYGVTTP